MVAIGCNPYLPRVQPSDSAGNNFLKHCNKTIKHHFQSNKTRNYNKNSKASAKKSGLPNAIFNFFF